MDHLVSFGKAQNVEGATFIPIEDEGRSPFLIVDIPAFNQDN